MKLMEQVRQVLRVLHDAYRTGQSYCEWIVKFIRFHGVRHPAETGVVARPRSDRRDPRRRPRSTFVGGGATTSPRWHPVGMRGK